MLSAYHVCLFIHLSSIFVLFMAMGVSHIGMVRMEKAETREIALENCKMLLDNSVIFPVASVCVVGSGLFMALTSWNILLPWIILSLSFVVISTLLGFAVMFPRLSRTYARLSAIKDGPLAPEVSDRRRDPVAALLPSALAGNAVGTAFVMVTKPGWAVAIAAFVGFSIAGLIPVWNRGRESWLGWRRARELERTRRINEGGKPILCDVLDPKLVVVETVSPFTLKAHKALKAAGVDYLTRRSTQSSDYKHLNPKGQIPILILDGQVICGSREIVRLCAKWAPDVFETEMSPDVAAENHVWEEYTENTLKGFVASARWLDEACWERAKAAYFVDMPFVLRPIIIPRVRAAIIRLLKSMDVGRGGPEEEWQRYLSTLDALEQRAPRTGWWLGTEKLTPCDISVYAFLQCLRTSITPDYHQAIIDRPKLNAYLDRVEALTKRAPKAEIPTLEPSSALVEIAAPQKVAAGA
jgi:glutathione S-transferase